MRLGLEAALVDGELVAGDLAVDGGVVTAVGLARKGREWPSRASLTCR